jgi:orotate phosphoribosyltransferase
VISLQDFEDTGALLKGHFRLSSGLHSDTYLQCARLLMWPERAEAAGRELAGKLREFEPRAIVSPALGGIVIGHETAAALAVPSLFAERQDGAFLLRRGFFLTPGEGTAVVEDVFTTGKSTREVIDLVERMGARVVAAGSIVDRGLEPGALRVPSRSLLHLSVAAWPEEQCPLCREGRPLETPGSRYQSGPEGGRR